MERAIEDKRSSVRTTMKSRVRVCHDSFGALETHIRDLSDGGVFLYTPTGVEIEPGSILSVQLLGLPGGEGPQLKMEVVRADPEGVGLRFV